MISLIDFKKFLKSRMMNTKHVVPMLEKELNIYCHICIINIGFGTAVAPGERISRDAYTSRMETRRHTRLGL